MIEILLFIILLSVLIIWITVINNMLNQLSEGHTEFLYARILAPFIDTFKLLLLLTENKKAVPIIRRSMAGVNGNPPNGKACVAIGLGGAGGMGCGNIWGVMISAQVIVGSSTVISSRVEDCCEE